MQVIIPKQLRLCYILHIPNNIQCNIVPTVSIEILGSLSLCFCDEGDQWPYNIPVSLKIEGWPGYIKHAMCGGIYSCINRSHFLVFCAILQSTAQCRRPSHKVHVMWFAFFLFVVCFLNSSLRIFYHAWWTYIGIPCSETSISLSIYCTWRSPVDGAVMQQTTGPCFRGFPWSASLKSIALPV